MDRPGLGLGPRGRDVKERGRSAMCATDGRCSGWWSAAVTIAGTAGIVPRGRRRREEDGGRFAQGTIIPCSSRPTAVPSRCPSAAPVLRRRGREVPGPAPGRRGTTRTASGPTTTARCGPGSPCASTSASTPARLHDPAARLRARPLDPGPEHDPHELMRPCRRELPAQRLRQHRDPSRGEHGGPDHRRQRLHRERHHRVRPITIADNITIRPISVVNHSFPEPGITIGGAPAWQVSAIGTTGSDEDPARTPAAASPVPAGVSNADPGPHPGNTAPTPTESPTETS